MDKDNRQIKHRRSRVEITADILRLLRLGNTGKTQITHYANLRWDQGLKYIDYLLEENLMERAEEEMGLPCYRITKKGLAVLNLIENLEKDLKEYELILMRLEKKYGYGMPTGKDARFALSGN